jgi:hypothetical protein
LIDEGPGVSGLYKPKTQETRNTFAIMLDYIQDKLGDQVFFIQLFVICLFLA